MATNSSHFLSLSTASNVLQSQIQMQKFQSNQILTVCKLILNQYQFDMMIDNRWTLTLFLLQEKYNQLLAQIPELRWILKNPRKKYLTNQFFKKNHFRQVDGPTRGGLPVFQAHAGQRSPRNPPHGDAPREKEIVITHEWVSSSETRHIVIFQPVLPKDDWKLKILSAWMTL